MLNKVESIWVKGVLENSLYGAVLLELGKTYDPQAVERLWGLSYRPAGQSEQNIPPGTPMIEVFDKAGRALLILGEPGSGKTTTLLELTRDLIHSARHDDDQPIPVVFKLSSWAAERKPLQDWLVDQLGKMYDVRQEIARPWVAEDDILPLLDGLDEMPAAHRAACVAAINDYRHGLTGIAVCSRKAEYDSLTGRLALQNALVLQPLTSDDINLYLTSLGDEVADVRGLLDADEGLRELAESPLMLSVMALAYRGVAPGDLPGLSSEEARRKHLFDVYVERMFEHRPDERERYSLVQTRRWLVWLARRMAERDQTVFHIEHMQPDWLPDDRQRRQYRVGSASVAGLVGGLGLAIGGFAGVTVGLSGLLFGLAGGLIGGLLAGLALEVIVGLVDAGLAFGFIVGLVHKDIQVIESLSWSWRRCLFGMVFGMIFGLAIGLFGGLVLGLAVGLVIGLAGGLADWLIVGLVFGGSVLDSV